MPVYKDKKTGKWFAMTCYTNVYGERKQKCKRGFKTRSEALEWEREFALTDDGKPDMLFKTFVDIYLSEIKPRIKENTYLTKESIFNHHILPYFGERKLNEITSKDVIRWQNELLSRKDEAGNPRFKSVYLKTIHNQLSASLNYAVKFYRLPSNPAAIAGNMGKEKGIEMKFWTREEYNKFIEAVMDKEQSYYAFEMLYWTGIRLGELLALTPADFDFETKTLTISKSYQKIKGRDVLTPPKTAKSNRAIKMPDFLCFEMQDYFSMIYGLEETDRIFTITKSYLHHEMDRGATKAGVKRIRIHDIRHSHVSLLIDMGFSPVAIADRVGHESIDITYKYAHLFPTVQDEMVKKLNGCKGA